MYRVYINNKEYTNYLVEGFTFEEELNETLDSGSIILSQIDRLNLKPFDDVIIHNGDGNVIKHCMKSQFKYYDCGLAINKTYGYSFIDKSKLYPNRYTTQVSSTTDVSFKNILLIGQAIENLKEQDQSTEQFYEDFKIKVYLGLGVVPLEFNYNFTTNGSSSSFWFKNGNLKIRGAKYNRNNVKGLIFNLDDEQNVLEGQTITKIEVDSVLPTLIATNYYYRAGEGWQYKLTLSELENFDLNTSIMSALTLSCDLGEKNINYDFILNKEKSDANTLYFESQSKTYIIEFKNKVGYFYGFRKFDFFTDVRYLHLNYKNKNNDVIVKPSFYKHLLINTFTEERLNLSQDNLYKYKSALMSETKGLEKIQCPNLSITQPLNANKRHTVWEKLNDFINLYNIKIKIASENGDSFYVENKYTLDPKLEEIFKDVIAPEFSLTNPNLRDLLSQLFICKDLIPVVKDNVITYLDLSKTEGNFDLDKSKINYIENSLSSSDYAQNLKTQYSGALSQDNSGQVVEYLGFRNSDKGLMTLNDLQLETRYPIYKINKIYMCYYKRYILTSDRTQEQGKERVFLCRQDITPLIMLDSLRNTLSTDWLETTVNKPTSLEEAAKYKMYTLGYSINTKKIKGFGTTYSYPIKGTWYDVKKTYIENILDLVDGLNPYGDKSYNYFRTNESDKSFVIMGGWRESIVAPSNLFKNNALAMKSLIFQIEYQPFYNGVLIHSKDNEFGELVDNDTNSNGLVLVESDGIFKKEKINRLGNNLYQINALYNDPSELQKLGSVIDGDNVVYHRSYTIFNNLVKANYFATKDYIMKNYYTSVWAQKRPYNLLDYSQAISRCENKKVFLMLDKNEMYNDGSNLDFTITNTNENVYSLLVSAFKENEHPLSKNSYLYNDKINTTLFVCNNKQYMSDLNAFVSGNSLCLNSRMYDNVSGGVCINKIAPDVAIIDLNDDYTKGTTQEWLLMVDDRETGEIKNIGVYFCHTDQSEIFKATPRDYNSELEYENLFKNVIFKLPLNDNFDVYEQNNLIGADFEIKKDNKELLDFTFQIEPITKDKDIKFSPLFSKLNNLINIEYKNDVNYDIEDEQVIIAYSIIARYYTVDIGATPEPHASMVIKIPKDILSSIKVNDVIKFNYAWVKQRDQYGERIFAIYEGTVKEISSSKISIAFITYFSYFNDIGQKIEENRTITKTTTLTSSGDNYYNGNPINFENANNVSNGKFGGSDADQRYANKESGVEIVKTTMNKNMFVLFNQTRKLSGIESLNELKNISGDYTTDQNLKVSEIFKFGQSENGVPFVNIDLTKVGEDILIKAKTIEYWFYDENVNAYKFVFGVNLSESDKTNKNVKIYLSLLSNKNLKVYGSNLLIKGKSCNFVNSQKQVNKFAKYDLI